MRVLICGSRLWEDADTIRAALEILRPDAVLHGACRGADCQAGCEAAALDIDVEEFPADWSLGPSAGPIRNSAMLQTKPDLVVAFVRRTPNANTGTYDTVNKARRMGIPVVEIYGAGCLDKLEQYAEDRD
mgnify:CR=1 FL=1